MDELNPCVKELLCGLNKAAQTAIRSAIGIIILQIETQITALNAYLIYLNILTAPLNLVNKSIKQVAQELRSLANIIPLPFLASCLDLTEVVTRFNVAFESDLAYIDRIVAETNRYLSLKDEVEAVIADLQAGLDVLKQIDLVIGACDDSNA